MQRKPARLYPEEDDIIEKIKPYLTREVVFVVIFVILFLLAIILAYCWKSPYNIEFV